MAFDDFLGDGQTQSGLRILPQGDEGFEDLGTLIERYVRFRIRHR